MMKNIIKKISAVAMAFTMLATGTALSSNDELTVHAACNHYNCRRYATYHYKGNWVKYKTTTEETKTEYITITYYKRYIADIRCANCGKDIGDYYDTKTTKQITPKLFPLT